MKIEITKHEPVKRVIEVEFPYYYKHDMYPDYGESVIYGKIINEYKEITIHEREDRDEHLSFEIEEDSMSSSYFDEKYKSSKEEYELAKRRALDFLNDF